MYSFVSDFSLLADIEAIINVRRNEDDDSGHDSDDDNRYSGSITDTASETNGNACNLQGLEVTAYTASGLYSDIITIQEQCVIIPSRTSIKSGYMELDPIEEVISEPTTIHNTPEFTHSHEIFRSSYNLDSIFIEMSSSDSYYTSSNESDDEDEEEPEQETERREDVNGYLQPVTRHEPLPDEVLDDMYAKVDKRSTTSSHTPSYTGLESEPVRVSNVYDTITDTIN